MKTLDARTKKRINQMIELLGNTKEKIILDLGASVIGISSAIKQAKKIITLDALEDSNVAIRCDLNKDTIPLGDKTIDIIIAGEIIEHIPRTIFFLKECKRVLKDEGYIILSTPNLNSLKDRIRVLFGLLPLQCARFSPEAKDEYLSHVREFNLAEIKRACSLVGLEIIEQKTNGLTLRSKMIWPAALTPVTFGESLILKIRKKMIRPF